MDTIRHLLKGPKVTAANVIYLQNTVHKFRVNEDGKEWSVYGSPVTIEFLSANSPFANMMNSGHPNSATGHSIMNVKTARVI